MHVIRAATTLAIRSRTVSYTHLPDGSLAIKAEESGFDGGIVTVIVGMDANGTETGIWVDASTQTKGCLLYTSRPQRAALPGRCLRRAAR